jgi:hypothetical protein
MESVVVDLIKVAEGRLRELETQLRRLPTFQEWEATRQYLDTVRGLQTDQSAATSAGVAGAAAVPRGSQPTWAQLAKDVLLDIGRPVNSKRLVMEMAKRGRQVGGAKPDVNLASILSKATSINSVQWGGRKRWWPAGENLPLEPEGDGVEDAGGEPATEHPPA